MVAAIPERHMPSGPPHGRRGLRRFAELTAGAAPVAAIPLAIAVGLLVVEDALEFGDGFLIAALVGGFTAVVALLVLGWRYLRAAERQTKAAFERAAAAEAAQCARA